MYKMAFIAVLALLFIVPLAGCSAKTTPPASGNTADNPTVTIVITRDFGRELIVEQEISINPGTSAMDALQTVASVGTKYGGGFIDSINGISSEYGGSGNTQRDWFFYVNGISSNVGAGDYILRDGDVEHCDFRDWSYQMSVPAIIGDYPQPFLSGFGGDTAPTIVVYEDSFSDEAASLVESLEQSGVTQVSSVPANELQTGDKAQSNLIIIAGPQNSLICELNDLHKRLGFYAYIEYGVLVSLDAAGNRNGEHGTGCGLIQATQNPWNPNGTGACENVVWMVTGTDIDGVKSAASALTNRYEEMLYAYAVVVDNEAIVKIP